MPTALTEAPSREAVLHSLYEAAELEHTLMCTYLYAAFSLKTDEGEGLSADQLEATRRWRRVILDVAIDEMGHLASVWNITVALGGAPRFGRPNFPLDPGFLPAGLVVKLAPFSAPVLQHFVHLERPHQSDEPEGEGFAPVRTFKRAAPGSRLTPMGADYDAVGDFYQSLSTDLRALTLAHGEPQAFCGDPKLQLSPAEVDLNGLKPVACLATALEAFQSIIAQGEGSQAASADSHFQKFLAVRAEFDAFTAKDPAFSPAWPAARNPVLRRPPNPEGRVWIEHPEAVKTVDLANAAYGLMIRLMTFAYSLPSPDADKAFAVDAGIGLMQALTLLGERAARLPAGPSNPGCNAGVSFTAPRDASAFPDRKSARTFFIERFEDLARAGGELEGGDDRAQRAAALLADLSSRAGRRFSQSLAAEPAAAPAPAQTTSENRTVTAEGVEFVEGEALNVTYDGRLCIHARYCGTGAPAVFVPNVEGAWIHPDAMDPEETVIIARACPSGAIRYQRKDGGPNETAPPVNLVGLREAGPLAVRGDIWIDEVFFGYRATLCRCGASKNKPFCDLSHREIGFDATGEPPTGKADPLAKRDGPIAISPVTDGPLMVRGNIEIVSGTGRVVARTETARLCRCGASAHKPFCDGSHVKAGFRSR